MHARVITHRVREGNLDRVIRVIRQRIAPAARRQPGFAGFVLMSNRKARYVVSTSYWETEGDMLASETAEYLQEQISYLIIYLSGLPDIKHYEVDFMS
ncbi:MAG TPA: antibiotic biosynthesis monooxygenase [Rubrobacter sp.]|nr:antibiotic biosynthesis monooxygenase [Rubrobacter sp.]